MHDAAAAPELRDVREVEVVALVGRQRLVAGVAQDVEAFGVRLHQAVLDAVVDHLDEVAGAGRTAMQVATRGGARLAFASGRRRNARLARCERRENRLEARDRFGRAAHHQAVAALGSPHAAARARVDVVDALRRQRARAADIVFEPGVAAIDDRVARAQ